jgi:hypothetical protein
LTRYRADAGDLDNAPVVFERFEVFVRALTASYRIRSDA